MRISTQNKVADVVCVPQFVTCHTDKVVSGILAHRTILTDERGGQVQPTDNFSGKENAHAMICNTVHVGA